MELYKLENKKYIALCMVLVVILLVFRSHFSVLADNGWLTETPDGYYDIGNNMQVKVDILNGRKESIDNNNNLFYNGQAVYIKLNWRTIDDVEKATSMKLDLPSGRATNQISFEAPLNKNIEVISNDSRILTSLKSDGSTITAFFMLDDGQRISKGAEGTILIPHNIFVTPYTEKFLFNTMELVLSGDDGQKKYIRKEISKIDNGIRVDSFELRNKATNEKLDSFDKLENNDTILSFNYYSGSQGIRAGDIILLKLHGFDSSKNAKLKPFAYEMMDIYDDSGKKAGYMTFWDDTQNNSYIRVAFNNAFEGRGKVTGHIGVLTDLSFAKALDKTSDIGITANNAENIISIKGPDAGEENIELRLSHEISTDVIRKTTIINEADILKQDSSPKETFKQRKNYILSELVSEKNYHIDQDSIKILKLLSKPFDEKNTVSAYGFDSLLLKKENTEANRIVPDGSEYRNQSGMSIAEFEEYMDKKDIFDLEKDKDGNIIGFRLNLGDLNEPRGLNGEYVVMDREGNVNRIPRDKKTYGYVVYYNIVKNGASADLGTLRVLLTDSGGQALVNAPVVLNKKGAEVYSKVSDSNGYIEFNGLDYGDYVLKDSSGGIFNIPDLNFTVTENNLNNLDLKRANNNREDVSYEATTLSNSDGSVEKGYINIIESEPLKSRAKIINKDNETGAELGNAEFEIYSNMGFRLEGNSGILRTVNGEALTEPLPLGEYYLVQTKASTGYSLDGAKIPFELKSKDKIETVEVLNSCMSPIKIFNYYTDGGERKGIEGTLFKLYSYQDLINEIETLITDKNGYSISQSLPYGKYFIKQFEIDSKYELIETSITVNSTAKKLDSTGAFPVEIENKKTGIVELLEDETPLSIPGLSDLESSDSAPINENIPASIISEAPIEASDKNNPTTGDSFSISHFIIISSFMMFLVMIRYSLSKDPNKAI